MKKKLSVAIVLMFFILLLLFPNAALEGSSDGLMLWFYTVLPTLLPFIILTNFIMKLDAVPMLCRAFAPFGKKLFHINTYGCYALLTGLLCGYPMGAKITADLVREKKLTREHGDYLLGICNNASPMFVIGYVITQSLRCPQHKPAILMILYGTPLLYAMLTRPALCSDPYRNSASTHEHNRRDNPDKKKSRLSFQVIDESIMNGFETITRLGGYIILFAIIAKMATAHLHTVTMPADLFIGFIEITNGIHSISLHAASLQWQIPCVVAIITFGGLSGIAQTKSMTWGTSLSMPTYIHTKLRLSCMTFLLSMLYCRIAL